MGEITYKEYTWIGSIVGVKGVRGEIRVKYYTDSPEYYLNTKVLFIEKEGDLLPKNILKFKKSNKGWAIIFEGVSSRDAAEEIKGCRLLIPDKELKPLEKNEFFVHQLIGCRVEDLNGCFLGNVSNFFENPANNLFEVKNGEKEFLIPDVQHVVLELDLKKKRMIINPIPGLI